MADGTDVQTILGPLAYSFFDKGLIVATISGARPALFNSRVHLRLGLPAQDNEPTALQRAP